MEGREYVVACQGRDTDPGTRAHPLRTIQRAADLMEPGDVCTIRGGTYREWVRPPRGGTGEEQRVTYRAAPGEEVVIKASEHLTAWTRRPDGLWVATLADDRFGLFHPFRTRVSGDWLHHGLEYHLGLVYVEGEALQERFSMEALHAHPGSFLVREFPGHVELVAACKGYDPRTACTEVAVRECCFFPAVQGLAYITVEGLTLLHASANWTAWRSLQRGALGTHWGYRWIIRNCCIADARCTGLVCGNEASPENEGFDMARVGRHQVLRNHILRCGQAGIHGDKGWAGSVIADNLIEDINTRREFGGEETAGIKLHHPIDVTVRGNVIRGIRARREPGRNHDFAAIWIDWAGQNVRVSGNVVYGNEAWALFLQNNHGSPILIDNNIFSGMLATSSEGCVWVHNLLLDTAWTFIPPYETVSLWHPHSAVPRERVRIAYRNDRYLNNVFVGKGSDAIPPGPGVQIDWNVYCRGAQPSAFDDRHSLLRRACSPLIQLVTQPSGVDVQMRFDTAPEEVQAPFIDHDFIGVFTLTGQGVEDADGRPTTVDTDIRGVARDRRHPVAGPVEHRGGTTLRFTRNLF